jgi:hypothetical protein
MRMRVRRLGGRRCLASGCGRFVRSGRAVCAEHARSEVGREVTAAVGRLGQEMAGSVALGDGEATRERAARALQTRLGRGDYAGLFDEGVRRVMAEATEAQGLKEEIGLLRVTMARLLAELLATDDPVPVAHVVARVATATVRAVQAQRVLEPEPQDEFQTTLARVLDEMDAERDAMLAARDDGLPRLGGEEWPETGFALAEGV